MGAYILRRLLLIVPTLFGIMLINFTLTQFVPGGPIELQLQDFLTVKWISVGGQGGRGRAPGTVEEVGREGLVTRFISGHVETTKSMLALAEKGCLDLHVLPQGEMTELIEGQARGVTCVRSRTGLDTFLDPRCGSGSAVFDRNGANLVHADGDELVYELPAIDVALFCGAYADPQGNVYLTDVATITESHESVSAARANGGLAMAVVGGMIEEDPSLPRVPAEMLDAVVVNPYNEQTIMAPQSKPWKMFCPGGDGDDRRAIERLRFINRVLRLTPVRGPVGWIEKLHPGRRGRWSAGPLAGRAGRDRSRR